MLDSHVQYLPQGCQEFQTLLPKSTSSPSENLGVGEIFFLFLCVLHCTSQSTTSSIFGSV